jgi:hypothetical protein
MQTLHEDVRALIRINEKLQSHLLRGHIFSMDEIAIIQMCADELSRSTDRETVR